jgi:hypothetical protein
VRRRTWALAGAAVAVGVTATGGVVAVSGAGQAAPAAPSPMANTAKVVKGKLSDMVSQAGTLTYRARPDGSPYAVINQARGTYTELPEDGEKVACGDVLYRVDDQPVLLLCGATPAYRSLSIGDSGRDVAELNANLGLSSDSFTWETTSALQKLQSKLGEEQTGSLTLGQAVVLPHAVRIAKVIGELAGSARPGAAVLEATSATPEVQVPLDPSQQGELKKGDRARITLPDNSSVTGKVSRVGSVAQTPSGQNDKADAATIPVYVSLDDPKEARGLDQASVGVEITTKGVQSALSVPVTAIVGKSGGGFAVEAVRAGGRRELLAVKLGLFDTAGGRVQVEGDLREGDRVVVPSL